MIYFRKNDEIIEKYQISFDKEEIEKLKKEIINKCSFIQHIEYESDYQPRFTDKIIKNFKCEETDKTMEYFEETRRMYKYSYDEYTTPHLVELIDQLLNGNSKVIDEIYNYDDLAKLSIDDKINLVNNEFNKINAEDIISKKEKLNELEKLLELKKINKNQQSIELYYNQLIKLIRFDLIDSILINDLSRVESFLEINLSSNDKISSSKNILLKKINIG